MLEFLRSPRGQATYYLIFVAFCSFMAGVSVCDPSPHYFPWAMPLAAVAGFIGMLWVIFKVFPRAPERH
jgi:peptidoglycan/LPS O-acetylase OafA/YrhL